MVRITKMIAYDTEGTSPVYCIISVQRTDKRQAGRGLYFVSIHAHFFVFAYHDDMLLR